MQQRQSSATPTVPSSKAGALDNRLRFLLIACVAIIFLVLAWPLFLGKVYTYDDLANSNLPMQYSYAQSLKAGDNLLWTPQVYCGVYMHGESEVGMCHPLHLFLFSFLPIATAFQFKFVANFAGIFFGMFFFLRHLKLDCVPALFGAMLFGFAGFNLWHFMHMAPLAVIAHLPWLLIANDILLCSNDPRQRRLAGLAIPLLTASQCLLGHPQFVYFSVLAESAFVLMRIQSWASWWRAPLLIGAKLLGTVIGAVQLLPLLDMVSTTDRSEATLDFRLSYSMHPLNLLQLVSPFALKERYYAGWRWGDGNTHEMGIYTGAFCSVVIAWFGARWRQLGPQRWFLFFIALFGLGALVLSLGKFGGIYPLLVELPGLKTLAFRAPTRFGLLFHLALAILSAFAFADLMKLAKEKTPLKLSALWPLVIPVVLSAATWFWVSARLGRFDDWSIANLSSSDDALSGLLLIGAAAAFIALAARGHGWALYGIVGLTFLEISVWGLRDHIIRRGPPKSIAEIIETLPKPPTKDGRIFYWFATSGYIMDGYNLTRGNIGLVPAKKLPVDVNGLRLSHTTWAVTGDRWSQVPAPMPRLRMVSEAVVSQNITQALASIDIAKTGIVEDPVDIVAGEPGRAEFVKDRPGNLEIKVNTPTRQLLVLADSYHAGWNATVNGASVPVVRTYGDFMGCVVDAGVKTVVMKFAPRSFSLGLKVTLVGVVLLGVWFLVETFLQRKQSARTP
jgi:hypothetical protein